MLKIHNHIVIMAKEADNEASALVEHVAFVIAFETAFEAAFKSIPKQPYQDSSLLILKDRPEDCQAGLSRSQLFDFSNRPGC
jgi:hypothetical protein